MLFFFKLSILLLGKVLTIFLIQNNFFVLNSFTLIIVENLSSFIFFKGKYSFSNLIVFNISILLSILILHFQIHLFLFIIHHYFYWEKEIFQNHHFQILEKVKNLNYYSNYH